MKANGEKQYYYTRERINAFASLIVALVIIALLIVPIYLLYSLVKNNGDADGVLNDRATATCIGILLTFTLLFSAVISLFTRAKRHEVLGAAAGYVWRYTCRKCSKLTIQQVLRRARCLLGQCAVLM
jgi:uncharacterized BrkB/YihY/UPF0761 family membrane protein